jgi:ABC-type hemin transport system ATPase subunit
MSSNSSEIVIAVMGMTGAGKSSFIKRVSGREDIIIGHKLSSGLTDVSEWRGRKLIRSAFSNRVCHTV